MYRFILFTSFVLSIFSLQAQEISERNSVDLNDIEIWVKDVKLSAKSDTAIVELNLQSFLKNPREFRLNTFASGVMNGSVKPMWYSSILMGNVIVKFDDKQNYLHYLLSRDEEVKLTIKTPNWKKQWGKPKQVKLTFEDHTEEGKFLEYLIDL